jgi:NADH:quinone reductase (non-electrogenic)
MSAHRVVIVGGGFAGIRAANALARLPVEVTLIDRANHHLFQPLLYQVATGVLSAGQIAPPLRSLFRGQDSVRVVLADVEAFDLDRRVVHGRAETALEIPYDTLIVAAGATHSYFGHEAWADASLPMKTLDDAHRLRSHVLRAFEVAEQMPPGAERNAWLTFAVVGAGPTGVELAGQLSVLARRILKGEYRAIDPADARIVLFDGGPVVLPAYHGRLSAHAQRDLQELGIEVEVDSVVVGVDPTGVEVARAGGRSRIAARSVIWAAGVEASPLGRALAESSGAELDRAGRLRVAPDLTLPGHPEVFVVGDMALVQGVPGLAPAAIQEGVFAAKVIKARIRDKAPPSQFKFRDRGSIATIGRLRAVGVVFGLRVAGLPAFVLWGAVHLYYLIGWGNRLGAIARWMWNALARNRRERLISLADAAESQRLDGDAPLRLAA